MKSRLGYRVRFALAALALASLFLVVVLSIPDSAGQILFSKWGRFIVMTLVLFGFLLKVYWRARSSLAFWSLLAGFMILHTVAIGSLYWIHAGVPFVFVGVVGGAEIAGFALLIHRVLGIEPRMSNKSEHHSPDGN